MDQLLLGRADGPVVVTALAGAVGRDYRTSSENGVRHFRALGATDVVVAPDAREDRDTALAILGTARLLVLPGGSPSRLLDALNSTGVADLLRDLLTAGGTVMGASAGAMVLCDWTVLPDRRGPGGVAVASGLGIISGMVVVPHWTGERDDWLQAVPEDVQVVGLPEESGVMVEDGILTAVGRAPTRLVTAGRDLGVGDSWRPA